ncbi:MAG TPA: DUF1491 family protein [Microvirga sp.]|jgi:hypothetical protein
MSRLRSDFWVSAYLRRCAVEGVDAVLRRRGAAEAGAVFVKLDHLDGTASLYGPAPQSLVGERADERRFARMIAQATPLDVEERMTREGRFDPDYWLVEVDSREGRHLLDLAEPDAD